MKFKYCIVTYDFDLKYCNIQQPIKYNMIDIKKFQSGTTRNEQYQRTFVTRNGLVFSSLAGAYFMAIITTACTFSSERTRYYQVHKYLYNQSTSI